MSLTAKAESWSSPKKCEKCMERRQQVKLTFVQPVNGKREWMFCEPCFDELNRVAALPDDRNLN